MKLLSLIITFAILISGLYVLNSPEAPPQITELDQVDQERREKGTPAKIIEKERAGPESKQEADKKGSFNSKAEKGDAGVPIDWSYVDTLKALPSGEFEVSYEVVDDEKVALGDVLVSKFVAKGDEKAKLRIKLWDEGLIPYVIGKDVPDKKAIEDAIRFINEQTHIRWKARESEEDYVVFRQGNSHCLSYLGKVGGEQPIKLAKGCNRTKIMHEMFHAMGMYHEHSRKDRDDYIQIYWGNIEKKYWDQFKKIPTELGYDFRGPLDTSSILMYSQSAFAKDEKYLTISRINGQTYPGNSGAPTDQDIEKLNSIYMLE